MSPVSYSVEGMRLLHTSDWHLGRGFHGMTLREEQQQMLQTVCQAVQEHQVEAVLVTGDIYDRALPPEWAMTMLEDCLTELVNNGTDVILTSGNHDSARRLGFGRTLMAASGVHIRSSLTDAWNPVEYHDGESTLLIYGVPYLEPQLVATELDGIRANHTAVMTEVLRRIHQDIEERQQATDHPIRAVLMAHVFASSGTASASERHIGALAAAEETLEHAEDSIGGLAVVPLEVFDGFDYTALGHLHGRQRLADRIRYAGSPLRYSFSEETQAKGAWLIDTQALDAPDQAITALDWAIGRPVKRLSGEIEQILSSEVVDDWQESLVQITLTDDERPAQAYQRLREVYPYLMSYSYEGAGSIQRHATYSQQLQQAESELDVITSFLGHVRQRSRDEQEAATLTHALNEVRVSREGAEQA